MPSRQRSLSLWAPAFSSDSLKALPSPPSLPPTEPLLDEKQDDKKIKITSDYESGESPTNSDYNSDTDKLHLQDPNHLNDCACMKMPNQININTNDTNINSSFLQKLEEISEQDNKSESSTSSDLEWHPFEPNTHALQKLGPDQYNLQDWNFPIFRFYEDSSKKNILSQVTYKVFLQVGLFKSFDIPLIPFLSYFQCLEAGYKDLPYHNVIHAADVLHACYFLTTQGVPGFEYINNNTNSSSSSTKTTNERTPLFLCQQ